MASFLGGLKNIFRQKREEAAKAMADPIRDGKFAIADAKKQIQEWTTQVAKLRASTIRQEAEHKDALAEKKKYTRIAEKAGEAGEQADVEAAVEQIKKWMTRSSELKKQIDQNGTVQKNLQKQLDAARTKVSRAEQNHQTLATRKKGTEIRKALLNANQKFADGQGGLAALDDLEEAVLEEESEVQAMEEMSAPAVETDLADKYSGDTDSDDMVAKFMAKSGK